MTSSPTAVYLGLGSNIEPEVHLCAAVAALRKRFGAVLLSPVYRTPAVGFEGPDFLNAAVCLHTNLEPQPLDDWLHELEARQGRRRDGPRFSSRTLDIDILLYGSRVMRGAGHLDLPRPELATQAFVLKPMVDIAPDVVHPVLGVTLRTLYDRLGEEDSLQAVDLACAEENA